MRHDQGCLEMENIDGGVDQFTVIYLLGGLGGRRPPEISTRPPEKQNLDKTLLGGPDGRRPPEISIRPPEKRNLDKTLTIYRNCMS
jgi:hypothetical protein